MATYVFVSSIRARDRGHVTTWGANRTHMATQTSQHDARTRFGPLLQNDGTTSPLPSRSDPGPPSRPPPSSPTPRLARRWLPPTQDAAARSREARAPDTRPGSSGARRLAMARWRPAALLVVALAAVSVGGVAGGRACIHEFVPYEGDTVSGNFVVVDHDIFWSSDHPGIDLTVPAAIPSPRWHRPLPRV
ncbi:hypothetical protein HU200_009596 [Digitaria exilis]|uniref:Uncharacterized protein n=1 Tax=Digitaria exilis TaxID=1010633 RepID=A0A835KP78_9POAL|nr:hypothetical protein HU200_009596 [Digitaria exilis]